MPDSFDQLAALIRARFSELSPQFQAGAAFLLDIRTRSRFLHAQGR